MERKKRSIIWKIEKDEMEKIVRASKTMKEILEHFGFSMKGGNNKTLKNRLISDNIDFSHIILGCGHNKGLKFPEKSRPIEEYLVENYNTNRRGYIKKRLIKEGILENKCSICGQISEWNGFKLVMVLDHINGIPNDNRLENLRLLCPNCNSQQSTFAGRSLKKRYNCSICGKEIVKTSEFCRECDGKRRRKIERPTKEELEKLVIEMPMTKIGEKFGVSDNAIRKWCIEYDISLPKKNFPLQKINCSICGNSIVANKSGMCHICHEEKSRKITVPDKNILIEKIKTKSLRAIAKDYGVNRDTVSKWMKKYSLIE